MKKLFAIALLASFTTLAAPLQWTCDWPEAKSQTFSLYQGETATIEPTFRVNGRTVTNATIEAVWYQTNGMGNAWWKLDGATFAPSNDVGAAAYRFFVEAKTSDDILYRANGALRMLPSPGFTPNAIAAPVQRIDFATVEVSNAPWALTNDVESIRGDIGSNSDAIATNAADIASHSSQLSQLSQSIDYSTNNTALVETIEATAVQPGDLQINGVALSGNKTGADLGVLDLAGGTMTGPLFVSPWTSISGDNQKRIVFTDNDLYNSSTLLPDGSPVVTKRALNTDISATAVAATNHTDSVAASIRTEVGSVSNDVSTLSDTVATLSAEIAPAVTAYPRVYAFMTGSTNANFVVTNYQLTAEADAERTHFDPADPDLDFSTVPSSLRLEDFSTGTNRVVVDTRDWTVWYYACKIGSAIHTAYTTAVNTCRAWVNFTATGLENPVPDTLIVDVPNIWLMADKTFEKHVAGSNACWVIRSKDTVMPISDNAQSAGGFLELTDAFGEPYIRFNKTESYFVDPQAEGITNTNGTWYVVYPTQSQPKGGANAVIEGSTTYPGKAVLKAEDDPDCPATITWTGGAGHWVMVAVPKLVGGVYPSKMFFGAVVEVQGQDYIEYLRPMSIPHLLVDGVKISPQIPASHPTGTSITWKVVE